jgi:hypothetical protein
MSVLSDLFFCQHDLLSILIIEVIDPSVSETFFSIKRHLSFESHHWHSVLYLIVIHEFIEELIEAVNGKLLDHTRDEDCLMELDRWRAELEEPTWKPFMSYLDHLKILFISGLREELIELSVSCFLINDVVRAVNYPRLQLLV